MRREEKRFMVAYIEEGANEALGSIFYSFVFCFFILLLRLSLDFEKMGGGRKKMGWIGGGR